MKQVRCARFPIGAPASPRISLAKSGTTLNTASNSNAATPNPGVQFNLKVVPSDALINGANGQTGQSLDGVTDNMTKLIEALQKVVNAARVEAGSQYAALESAVAYTTDLTAQYELGFNTVNDVNFSMETAHLAKNQILQQAATAMLAQANQGQQSLLQLIQG